MPDSSDPYHVTSKNLFIDGMTDLLLMTRDYRQQRAKAAKAAADYCAILTTIIQSLFDMVKTSILDLKVIFLLHIVCDIFQVQYRYCEVIYSFCEETCFPIPQEFTEFFSMTGYNILERPMFIQYIRRDVFKVTEQLVKHVSENLPQGTSTCEDLMTLLLRKLQDRKREIRYYESLCTGLPHMIDYFHSLVSIILVKMVTIVIADKCRNQSRRIIRKI